MFAFIYAYYKYVPAAIIMGVIIDLFLGDPERLIHPVQIIGKLISALEKLLMKEAGSNNIIGPGGDDKEGMSDASKFWRGVLLWSIVTALTGAVSFVVLFIAYKINGYLMFAIMTVMSWQSIAAKSLSKAAMKVYKALSKGDIEQARKEVSMIVGRDTDSLDDKGIARAAVETVAENTNDGVICPLFFLMLGGPVFAFIYKAVSTMDSMIGYKNDKYLFFGRFAAKADDVFAFVPARLSAVLMITASGILELIEQLAAGIAGRFRPKVKHFSFTEAIRIYSRDRNKHASPNSAHCESVCAGALGLRLGGPTLYFGKLYDKPYIGDAKREIEYMDIRRSCLLIYLTEFSIYLIYIIAWFIWLIVLF